MKKRILLYSIFCALSMSCLGLVSSCNNDNPTTIPSEEKELKITINGDLTKGKEVDILVKDSDGKDVSDIIIEVIEGNNLVTLKDNKLTLLEVGNVKLKISKIGYKTTTYNIVIKDVVLEKMNVELKGYLYHGETIEVIIKDKNNNLIEGAHINLTKGADFAIVNGNKISLLDAGEVAGTIHKDGYEDYALNFTSKTVVRIKELKDNVALYENKLVTVRGIVTASYGNTFYLMDGKNGFYVYNMNTLSSTSDPGDGIEMGKVLMNIPVLVTAKVDNGKFGLQLTGYSNREFIPEACVLKSNMTVQDPLPYEIKTEGDLMSLNASPKLAGSRIKVTAKFLGGDFSAAEQTNAKNAIFTFQYGTTSFDAKFNKYGSVETVKAYWNKENIEIGDYVTIESNFTHYQDHISVDLCNEGTYLNNESKDPSNIVCSASQNEVIIGKDITLSSKLPEGLTGEVIYEIISGKDFATIKGNILTGIKAGVVTIVAKVGTKQSMPIEIVVKDGATTTISSVRDLTVGTQVETTGNVVTFLKNGLVIQDETGYLYCISPDAEFYPQGINLGDTLKVSGVRYEYTTKRKIPAINQSTFEVITKKEITATYQKVTQADFKNFTQEELKYGKAVEFSATVDKLNKNSSTGLYSGSGYFVSDTTDAPGTEYFFYSWGSDKFLQNLTTSTVQAIVYNSYTTPIGQKGYVLLVVSAKEEVINPETISLQLTAQSIDTHLTFGSASCFADLTLGPVGASDNNVELVAIEGADLVKIEKYLLNHDYKISSTGKPGKVKLQAQTKDGKVKSNIVELTVELYVEQ